MDGGSGVVAHRNAFSLPRQALIRTGVYARRGSDSLRSTSVRAWVEWVTIGVGSGASYRRADDSRSGTVRAANIRSSIPSGPVCPPPDRNPEDLLSAGEIGTMTCRPPGRLIIVATHSIWGA
jgi:hypothetical protein